MSLQQVLHQLKVSISFAVWDPLRMVSCCILDNCLSCEFVTSETTLSVKNYIRMYSPEARMNLIKPKEKNINKYCKNYLYPHTGFLTQLVTNLILFILSKLAQDNFKFFLFFLIRLCVNTHTYNLSRRIRLNIRKKNKKLRFFLKNTWTEIKYLPKVLVPYGL